MLKYFQKQNIAGANRYTLLALMLLLGCLKIVAQPLTGTKTIPGNYASLSLAIADLNANGVGTGGVIFNVAAGYTETLTGPLLVTATGTSSNPITIQKSGAGANPLLTAYVGTQLATSATGVDGLIGFVGSDYVTVDGIDLLDPSTNTTPTTTMEYGYAFFKASATDGANNNTVKNCVITLNRLNVTSVTAGVLWHGSTGIQLLACAPNAVSTLITPSTISGASSNNKFYSNTIQNCNGGIALSGAAVSAPFTNADLNNDVGGNSAATGNTIINFGGGTGATSACMAVWASNQWSFNISYNTVNNNTGAGVNHPNTNRGIFAAANSVGASATINNNNVTIQGGSSTTAIDWAIDVEMAQSGANGNTISVNNNTISITKTTATAVALTAIWLNSAPTVMNCNNNTITNFVTAGTATAEVAAIRSGLAGAGTLNIQNNRIGGVVLTGTTGNFYGISVTATVVTALNITNDTISGVAMNSVTSKVFRGIYVSTAVATCAHTINNNIFQNITYTGGTPTGEFSLIYALGTAASYTINNNTLLGSLTIPSTGAMYLIYNSQSTPNVTSSGNNLSGSGINRTGASGTFYAYYNFGSPGSGTAIISNNICSNVTLNGTSAFDGFEYRTSINQVIRVINNTVTNIFGGTGTKYGIYQGYGAVGSQVSNNTIYGLSGGGIVYGIFLGSVAPTALECAQNSVDSLVGTSTSVAYGIYSSLGTLNNIHRNKINNIINTNAAGFAYGLHINGGVTANIYNNLIGNINTPAASGANMAIGINIAGATTVNAYNNTVMLNATSTGTNFGSSAISVSTTPNVTLQNNIFVNTSTPNGTGLAVAYRRSSTTITTYNNASNNNLYYAGTPGTNNVIFYDGTNSDLTLTAFQTRLGVNRDSISVTENVAFISSTASSSNYLKPATNTATLVEAGANFASLFNVDFAGNPRPGNPAYAGLSGLPDIGAIEDNYLGAGVPMSHDSSNTDQYTGVVPIGSNGKIVMRVRVYGKNGYNALQATSFKLSTLGSTNPSDISNAKMYYTANNANFSTTNQYGSTVANPSGTFYITGNKSLLAGVNYFWLVYDVSNTATPSGLLDATVDSITLSGVNYALINNDPLGSLQVRGRLAGNYNVGVGQTYTSINAAMSDLTTLGVSAPVTFTLTDQLYDIATGNITTLPINVTAFDNASATNTVTIMPATGNTAAITENAASAIFNLTGVNFFIIDGRQGGLNSPKSLSITNNSTSGSAVNFVNDASNNKLINTIFKGSSSTATNGVINFNAGLVRGNDSNLVDNCDIADGTTTPASLIQAAGSTDGTLAKYNDYNVISNCNVYNFWHASAESNAFKISNGNNYWTITGNSIYQTASRSGSSGYYTFNFQNSSNNNALNGMVVTNNYIGGSAPQCGGTPWTQTSSAANQNTFFNLGNLATSTFSKNVMANYNFTTTSTSATGAGVLSFVQFINGRLNIDSNTVGSEIDSNSIVITGGAGSAFVPIYSSASNTAGTYSISGNKFGGIKVSGGATIANNITLITVTSAGSNITFNIDNNNIGGGIANSIIASTSTGTQNITGISVAGGTAVMRIRNNGIKNLSNFTTGSGNIIGINVTNTASLDTITGNTITALTNGGLTQTNSDGSASIIGIQCISTGAGNLIAQNNVYGLTNVNPGNAVVSINGINVNNMTSSLITRNRIDGLVVLGTGSGASLNGINYVGGTTRVTNNIIRLGFDTLGQSIITTPIINGIFKKGGNFEGYFNSVFIGGDFVGTGTAQTFAFNRTTAGTDVVQNNVFVNYRNNSTTGGGHYVVGLNNTTTINLNYNVYHSVGNYDSVGLVNGVSALTMTGWRGISGLDGNTGFAAPAFLNTTGNSSSFDLHVSGTTPVEAAGTAVTGLGTDVDFDGQARLSLTPVDIGADAGNFIAADIVAPSISSTALTNTLATGDRTVNATITDVSGIYITGANRPRIYFKKMATGTYYNAQGTLVSGTPTNSNWTFTISATTMGGLTGNDSVYYYIIAQDSSTNNNTGSLPAGVEAINVSNIINHPGLPFGYKITPIISGTFYVGNGQTYPTLTGFNGMFSYLNTSVIGGNITINITSDIEEPGINSLNELTETGTGNYTITIVPDAASVRNITGSVATAGNGLIRLFGADRVTIDGSYLGSGKYLRFMNRLQAGVTFALTNDADIDTIKNCIIEGVNNTSGTILFGGSTKVGGTGNDSNVVMNCIIRDTLGSTLTSSLPNTGISSSGTSGLENNNNSIIGNEIYNFGFNAVNLNATGTGNSWNISNNFIYQQRAVANILNIIYVQAAASHTISNNSIGGAATDRSGAALSTSNTSTAEGISAIRLALGTGPATIVDNNTISNIGVTAAGGVVNLIWVSSGSANITNNTLGGGAMPYDTIRNGYDNGIINIASTNGNVLVNNNLIGNVSYYKAGGDRTAAMTISGGTHIITNNTIRNVKSNSISTGYLYLPMGIFLSGGTNHTVSQNTVSNICNTNNGTIAYTAAGINNQSTGSVISRNRVYNVWALGTGTGTSSPVVSGIYTVGTDANINNNQITVGDSTTLQTRVFGVQDVGTGNLSISNNSIFVNGANTTGGPNNSYGIFRGSSSTINVRNNIVYNKRTSDGTGIGFALGSTNAVTSANLNYNLLITNDTATSVQLGGLAYGWRDFSSIYALYNTNWAEKTSVVAANTLFIDTLVGNLGIVTSNPEAWYANGKGIAIAGLSNDFNSAAAVRSTTIATGSTDIGSVEFTPTVAPPFAYADKTPLLGDSTSFYFASRPIAKIVWGSNGSVPSTVSLAYYSGVNPSNTPSGKTMNNSFIDVQQTGGVGYTPVLTMMYDSATMGTVSNKNNLAIAQYTGTGTNWLGYLSTVVSNNGSMTANSVTANLGIFTGTDKTSNPLPVVLTEFKGAIRNTDALLSWTTASEINSKAFEIERSFDGKVFNYVSSQKAKGNSNTKSVYNYLDNGIFETYATVYYRLKSVDLNGSYTYSSTIRLDAEKTKANSIAVYPNPFTTSFTASVNATSDGLATIEVYDLQGTQVLVQNAQVVAGANTIIISNTEQLKSGIYVVKIVANQQVKTLKLVKE